MLELIIQWSSFLLKKKRKKRLVSSCSSLLYNPIYISVCIEWSNRAMIQCYPSLFLFPLKSTLPPISLLLLWSQSDPKMILWANEKVMLLVGCFCFLNLILNFLPPLTLLTQRDTHSYFWSFPQDYFTGRLSTFSVSSLDTVHCLHHFFIIIKNKWL